MMEDKCAEFKGLSKFKPIEAGARLSQGFGLSQVTLVSCKRVHT